MNRFRTWAASYAARKRNAAAMHQVWRCQQDRWVWLRYCPADGERGR